jgi:hypothetical protein
MRPEKSAGFRDLAISETMSTIARTDPPEIAQVDPRID